MTVGVWNTSQNPTDLARKSLSGYLTVLMPNGQAPLFGISSRLKEDTALQQEHGYYSKTMIFPTVTLTASYLSGATSFTVTALTNIVPGMILQNPGTRENMLVTAAVDGATSITVQRAFGNVAAAASIGAADQLLVIGTAFEEASVRPDSITIQPVRVLNYTQIFRNTWLVSGTEAAVSFIAGPGPDATSKDDCAMLHGVDIEKALLFSQPFQGTRNGKPIRTMEGIISRIISAAAANYVTLGSTTNYTQLESALDPGFQTVTDPKNPNERLFFAGGFMRRMLHNIFRLNSQYMINDQVTDWGLQFDQFKIPRGRFNLVEHSLLNAYGSTHSLSKTGMSLDLSSFSLAYMTGRKSAYKDFGMDGTPVDNGLDAVGGTVTSELTCLVRNPVANVVLTNATAALAG